jgi:hypothetical protein
VHKQLVAAARLAGQWASKIGRPMGEPLFLRIRLNYPSPNQTAICSETFVYVVQLLGRAMKTNRILPKYLTQKHKISTIYI